VPPLQPIAQLSESNPVLPALHFCAILPAHIASVAEHAAVLQEPSVLAAQSSGVAQVTLDSVPNDVQLIRAVPAQRKAPGVQTVQRSRDASHVDAEGHFTTLTLPPSAHVRSSPVVVHS